MDEVEKCFDDMNALISEEKDFSNQPQDTSDSEQVCLSYSVRKFYLFVVYFISKS